MGLESYLFYVIFKKPLIQEAIINTLESIGMNYLIDKSNPYLSVGYKDLFFELRTNKGLTEVHVDLSVNDEEIKGFHLRFSILSPHMVIDQTFALLKSLNELFEIEIYDTEIRNHFLRKLRQDGKVDIAFQGLTERDNKAIDKLCIVTLDVEDFKRNEYNIKKRQVIINNENGAIVEGGNATFDSIQKKGLFRKFLGWIKKELP